MDLDRAAIEGLKVARIDELLAALSARPEALRNEIIEECAKVADSFESDASRNYAGLAADAIRELKTVPSPLARSQEKT